MRRKSLNQVAHTGVMGKSVLAQFQTLRGQKSCALIPFITAGDPDLDTTAAALIKRRFN